LSWGWRGNLRTSVAVGALASSWATKHELCEWHVGICDSPGAPKSRGKLLKVFQRRRKLSRWGVSRRKMCDFLDVDEDSLSLPACTFHR
jgi:hypothetical protein